MNLNRTTPGVYLATKGDLTMEVRLYKATSGRLWARTTESLRPKWAETTKESPGISLAKLTRRGWTLAPDQPK